MATKKPAGPKTPATKKLTKKIPLKVIDMEQARERGRPAFEPSADQRAAVKQLTAFGIPQENICLMISPDKAKPISTETLRKYFAYEIENGAHEAVTKVAGALFKNAMEGNLGAQCFFLKTRGRWRESPTEIELTGKEGGAIQVEVARAVVSLPEYQDALTKVLEKY